MPTRQALGITLGARLFTLLALAAPVLWYRDKPTLIALVAVGVIWAAAALAERRSQVVRVVPTIEAALIGIVCGAFIDTSLAILLALALPPFVAAVLHGLRAACSRSAPSSPSWWPWLCCGTTSSPPSRA